FEDYKNFDEILNDKRGPNIILPIVDVLNKAAKKLNLSENENVNVDAVILNGGMTQFYMVADRLKEFFGFEPIAALDPDQAVARGAAVYHYYLHKYNELEDDMRRVQINNVQPAQAGADNKNIIKNNINAPIEWGSNILNDSLYLAMKNGVPEEIIPTGAELPYESEERTGFRLPIGANNISVPIQRRDNFGGAYLTIASGRVNFKRSYSNGAYVSFKVFMSKSKIITMRAALSADLEGQEQLEEREAVIDVGAGANKLNKLNNLNNINLKNKVLPPLGSELNAEAELHTISQLCGNYAKAAASKKSQINKQINDIISLLRAANNKGEFGQAFLKALKTEKIDYCKMRLLTTARHICQQWPDEERAQLAAFCLSLIQGELNSAVSLSISNIPIKEEAIRALALCGDRNILDRLAKLHDIAKFRTALVFAHSRTATQPDWLLKVLIEDYKTVKRGIKSSIGDTANAMCCMFRKYPDNQADKDAIIKFLHDAVMSNMLNDNELISCTLAIGAVCAKQDGI
ncbi:MAG: Hsp70 family protein, partial [Synergistaceae bacterium]|nr:Hsp70 family protein [Synergistaceae bacterium]